MIQFVVHGTPGPQGSKTIFAGGGSRESSAKVKPWREAVKEAYLRLPADQQVKVLGPVVLSATFTFSRPTSHYGTGRNAGTLKASAPRFPTGKTSIGDLSKLVRSHRGRPDRCGRLAGRLLGGVPERGEGVGAAWRARRGHPGHHSGG